MKRIKFTLVVVLTALTLMLFGPIAAQASSYGGIGITVKVESGWLMINNLVENGPAHQAGVQMNDVVTAIDGQAISVNPQEESLHIRGVKGMTVTLTISRSATNQVLTIPIVRGEINLSTVTWLCSQSPIRGFGKVWQDNREVRQRLNCPFTDQRQGEHATRAAVQTFEHGWMLWLETDTVANVDPIYVFYADDNSYIRFGDRPLLDANQYAPTETGFYKVGDRFTKIYWQEIGQTGRTRLGRATTEAVDSLGAFQEFEQGRMFWAGQADTIYVIYQGYYDLDQDGQDVYQQGWLAFKDTFENVESK